MSNGDRWSARRDHAIREDWPSVHGRKPLRTEEEKREAAKLRMRRLRKARRQARIDAALSQDGPRIVSSEDTLVVPVDLVVREGSGV
jgi:hypothetical protein